MSSPQPLVLIVNNDNFVGPKLSEVLSQKSLQIVKSGNFENLQSADYVILFGFTRDGVFLEALTFAAKHRVRFLFVTSLLGSEVESVKDITKEFSKYKKLDWRVVLLGDVYGPAMPEDNPIGRILRSATEGRLVDLSENIELYPVYIDDAVWGIEKCLFSAGTSGAEIVLAGQPVAARDFCSTMCGVSSLRMKPSEIDVFCKFTRPAISRSLLRRGRDLINWEPHTGLYEGIAVTLGWFGQNVVPKAGKPQAVEGESFWKGEKKKVESHTKMSRGKLAFAVLFIVVFYFLLLPFVQYGLGLLNFKMASSRFISKEYSDVLVWANASLFWFKNSQEGFDRMVNIPMLGGEIGRISLRSRILSKAAHALSQGGQVAIDGGELLVKIFGDSNYGVSQYSSSLFSRMNLLEQDLAFLEAQVSESRSLTKATAAYFSDIQMKQLRTKLRAVSGIFGYLPRILGEAQKRMYLVLVFDETELRPSGGYVGAYGLITIENGRVVASEFQSTDLADSQLSGYVEPPLPIKDNLGVKSWYLRDVAWSGDFSSTANRASWFIDKELAVKTDGVLSVDIAFLDSILSATGPVEVSSVGTVSTDNLYKTLQAGDSISNRPQTIVNITRAIFDHVKKNIGKESSFYIGKAIRGLDEKHLNFYLGEAHSSTLSLAGWGSQIQESSCKYLEICQEDYLYFTDANLGANKANYFLTRSFNLDVSLGDLQIAHRLIVNFENKGGGGWPGGDYKNYFRAYIPLNSDNVEAFLINPKDLSSQEVEIGQGAEKGKKVIGGFMVVPAGEARQLIMSWVGPSVKGFSEYALLWQKQPGTGSDPVYLGISGRNDQVLETTPTASLTSRGTIGYNTELKRDLSVNIKW